MILSIFNNFWKKTYFFAEVKRPLGVPGIVRTTYVWQKTSWSNFFKSNSSLSQRMEHFFNERQTIDIFERKLNLTNVCRKRNKSRTFDQFFLTTFGERLTFLYCQKTEWFFTFSTVAIPCPEWCVKLCQDIPSPEWYINLSHHILYLFVVCCCPC